MRPSIVASVAVHVAVIAAAILATARPAHTRPAPEPVERLYLAPHPSPSRLRQGDGNAVGSHAGRPVTGLPGSPTTVDVPTPAPIGTCQPGCTTADTTWAVPGP